MTVNVPSADLIARFAGIVGADHALTMPDDQAPFLHEWRDKYAGATPVVLQPKSTDEVSRILALASAERVAIVPQGGNTGLVGGQIPSADGHQILLSMSRLNRVRSVDATGGALVVEAGVTLAATQAAAEAAGRYFPLSLASEGSAQIGGILATNAGGTAVLAYGSARQLCLGLEAVLADGRVWHGLRALKKDNTGYDLRDLLIGSEGTLAVITAATLKLYPRPHETATAVVALASPDAALALFQRVHDAAGGALTAFEVWSQRVMDFALRYMPNVRDPLRTAYPWYALIEVSGHHANGQAGATLQAALEAALDDGLIKDAVVAQTLEQAQQFWTLRESFSEAQKGAGGSIKHDIAVPIARLPEFLNRAADVVERVCPGARPAPFGHFGDGNLHYNVSQPEGMDKGRFLALWDTMSVAVHDLVDDFGGSISAEHGIGQMKREMLVRYKSAVERDMMRAIKMALDPHGILNPGKVL